MNKRIRKKQRKRKFITNLTERLKESEELKQSHINQINSVREEFLRKLQEIATLKTKNTELESKLGKLAKEHDEMTTRLLERGWDYTNLEKVNAALERDNDELEKKVNVLTQRCSEFFNESQRYKRELERKNRSIIQKLIDLWKGK